MKVCPLGVFDIEDIGGIATAVTARYSTYSGGHIQWRVYRVAGVDNLAIFHAICVYRSI